MAYAPKCGVDDMVMLSSISENAVVENLKKRAGNEVIYTWIGSVLISVNPFKMIKGMYSERTLMDYRGKYRYELPPHVYSLADDVYRRLLSEREPQCVIISGESGAGKTEASKKIMQYIAAVSGNDPTVASVKDVLLQSNPLLEAFGNAKTVRNNNSSRFGKYMEIQFNRRGDPAGGRVTNYLLEKSRVVYQSQDERNFHIFYFLIAGGDNTVKNEWGLDDPNNFTYLAQSGCVSVPGMNDSQEYQDVVNAMDVVGISREEQQEVFKLCGAILWIGNLEFTNNEKDEAQITDQQTLEMAAWMLGVAPQVLSMGLLYRTIQTGTGGRTARMSTYQVPHDLTGAYYSRDGLAKSLYSRMFDWIILKVNQTLELNDPDSLTIGILDIYGFEIFQKNGFEQLCINYVNEKLQQIFIELTLKAEQEEYHAEGIQWKEIDYFNNKVICDLIESKRPIGIFALLDDVCNFPKASDEKFLAKANQSWTGNQYFEGYGQMEFKLGHYAGDVVYNVEGFIDKNKDTLYNDLILTAQASESTFVQGIYPEDVSMSDKKRPTTAGFKIKKSIGELVGALNECTPHYIRCIKPNDKKAANTFDPSLVAHQVRYLGLVENVRVRRAGFAFRAEYERFYFRFRVVCNKTWPSWSGDSRSACVAIMESLHLQPEDWKEGKTKLFIRQPETIFQLEELRDRTVHSFASKIQRFFMRFAMSQHYYDIRMLAQNEVINKKERRRNSIDRPYQSDYILYRENFPLKSLINANGQEKLLFADNCDKFDRRGRKQRRILIVTDRALYLVSLEKNKDKDKAQRKRKPFVYMIKRRVTLESIGSLTLTTGQDDFVALSVPNEHGNLLNLKRKTELIGTIKKHVTNVHVQVADSFQVVIKNKKSNTITVTKNPSGGTGTLKKTKITVGPGLAASTATSVPEPKGMPTVSAGDFRKQYGNDSDFVRKQSASSGPSRGAMRARGGPSRGRGGPSRGARGNGPGPAVTPRGGARGGTPRGTVRGRGGPPTRALPSPAGRGRGGTTRGRGASAPSRGLPPRGRGARGGAARGGASRGRGARGGVARGGVARGGTRGGGARGGAGGARGGASASGGARGGASGGARGGGGGVRGRGGFPIGGMYGGMAAAAAQRARGGRGAGGARGGVGRGGRGGRGGGGAPAPAPVRARPKCRAMFDFEAENDDELTFPEGVVITIVEETDADWWTGEYNGVTGLFPATFVERI